MPNDDKLTFLEQLSNALVGQTVTGGARALGEGIGYGVGGGALSDIPDVMREALERHKRKTANQTKNEQDALAVASGLAAMSNPVSAIGHGIDFAAAVPEMLEYKLSDAEPPIGMIAETGLKRRLQKGGAQADFARTNQLIRAKENIRDKGYKINPYIGKITPLESKGANWGPGEGKFQVIQDYETQGFDLNRATNGGIYGMGVEGDARIIRGLPHELGVEFANTMGLDPRYRDKGYGKQIYQNMADVYGGGISHSGSTLPEARKVYERLGAIDTGIPSGGGTRQALPTREMKADPAALAAFEQKVKEYAKDKMTPARQTEALDDLTSRDLDYLARDLERMTDRNNTVHESDISDLLRDGFSINLTGRNIPDKLDLNGDVYVRIPNTAQYKRQR